MVTNVRSLRLPIVASVIALAVLAAVPAVGRAQANGRGNFVSKGQPWLGVTYRCVNTGLEVTGVFLNSPAWGASLRSGNVITSIDGVEVGARHGRCSLTNVLRVVSPRPEFWIEHRGI